MSAFEAGNNDIPKLNNKPQGFNSDEIDQRMAKLEAATEIHPLFTAFKELVTSNSNKVDDGTYSKLTLVSQTRAEAVTIAVPSDSNLPIQMATTRKDQDSIYPLTLTSNPATEPASLESAQALMSRIRGGGYQPVSVDLIDNPSEKDKLFKTNI